MHELIHSIIGRTASNATEYAQQSGGRIREESPLMESNKRNADKDRKTIAFQLQFGCDQLWIEEWSHWLERAVSAEQRVAELEKQLASIVNAYHDPETSIQEMHSIIYKIGDEMGF